MKDSNECILSSTYGVRTAYSMTSHTPAQVLFSLPCIQYLNCLEIHTSTGLASETERISLISFTTG